MVAVWAREASAQLASASAVDTGRLRRDIAYLASDRLAGRLTGTPGNDSAAAFLVRRAAMLGLSPILPDAERTGCEADASLAGCRTFLQRFTARGVELTKAGHPDGVPTQNVVAMIPGRDPALRGQYIVVGAHFDHLGRSAAGALDPELRDVIRGGADDNASGTAAVLELARLFSERPPRRSLLFVNFSGEEMGLLGSQYFVAHSPVSLDSVSAMVNFDMIGRLRNERLIVYGVGTAAELGTIVDNANTAPALVVKAVGDGLGPSDHSSFRARGIPVLHFFTDMHEDYHKASDRVDKINVAGEARVIAMAERAVRAIADRPLQLTRVRSAAASRR